MSYENIFKALDKRIEDMEMDISIKDIRIQLLEEEVKKLKGESKCTQKIEYLSHISKG